MMATDIRVPNRRHNIYNHRLDLTQNIESQESLRNIISVDKHMFEGGLRANNPLGSLLFDCAVFLHYSDNALWQRYIRTTLPSVMIVEVCDFVSK